MVIRSIGNSLMVILPELVGKKITNFFDLVRPLIGFRFQTVGFSFTFVDLQLVSRVQVSKNENYFLNFSFPDIK